MKFLSIITAIPKANQKSFNVIYCFVIHMMSEDAGSWLIDGGLPWLGVPILIYSLLMLLTGILNISGIEM